MITLNTSRFGQLEIPEDRVIHFPTGLIGLPEINRYILIDHKDTPLKWLQAVDDPDIAFIVASPDVILEEYSLELDKSVKNFIQLDNDDDLAVLLTLRVDDGNVIANVQGPIVINSQEMKAVQVVLEHPAASFQKTR